MQHRGCHAPHNSLLLVIVLVALRALPGYCRSLRSSGNTAHLAVAAARNQSVSEIHEKWDKMDEFLKIMFTIACKWKHGKDINGAAAEKLKNGELEPDEVEGYKKELQAENLQAVGQACGKMTAIGKEKCRSGCSERWGEAMEQRSQCDDKCVTVYTRFETTCKDKAENLEKVYDMKLSQATARKRCYEGFCPKLPTVWMNEQGSAMEAERDTQCDQYCTAEKIEIACRNKWQLEVDFVKSDITSSCFGEGKVKECFEEKKTTASSTQTQCSEEGKTKCTEQFESCKADGKTDETFKEAGEFCTERKKMCESQVVDNCLKEFNTALDSAQKECEGGDSEAMATCETEKLATAEQEAMEKCTAERTPTCVQTCKDECNTDKLGECLTNLKSESTPTEDFCEDFWKLLHSSSEVDPVTGDPIVLLAN